MCINLTDQQLKLITHHMWFSILTVLKEDQLPSREKNTQNTQDHIGSPIQYTENTELHNITFEVFMPKN